MPNYLIYGLNLRASGRIPGLVDLSSASSYISDVDVCSGFMPWERSLNQEKPWDISKHLPENGEPALRVCKLNGDSHFYLRYRDGNEFAIDRQGTQIWAMI